MQAFLFLILDIYTGINRCPVLCYTVPYIEKQTKTHIINYIQED